MQINKTQTRKILFLSMMLAAYPNNALLAQPKPAMPVPVKPSTTLLNPTGAMFSAPLLSSPFSSPATKAKMRQVIEKENEAYNFVKAGDAFAKNNDWQNAQSQYQQALELSPQSGLGHQLALYGLINCCRATGDTKKGLDYSRQAIYRNGSAADGFYDNDTARLMQFVLLLNRIGQEAESVQVYNHAAAELDYQDSQFDGGQPHLKVLLPEIVMGNLLPGQVQYTPEHLQALADTALAHEEAAFGSNVEALAHAQEAVKLHPDSAVTQYYLGEVLLRTNDPRAKAAYQKAAALGDDKINDAVKERLKMAR